MTTDPILSGEWRFLIGARPRFRVPPLEFDGIHWCSETGRSLWWAYHALFC